MGVIAIVTAVRALKQEAARSRPQARPISGNPCPQGLGYTEEPGSEGVTGIVEMQRIGLTV